MLVLFYNNLIFSERLSKTSSDVLGTMLGSDNSVQSKFQCPYLYHSNQTCLHKYKHYYDQRLW